MKAIKRINYCDKYGMLLKISSLLDWFSNEYGIELYGRVKFIEALSENISIERLEQGWYDGKGQPLSNLIKRYVPKDWQKLQKWNDCWSKIVNEVKKLIVTQEIVYWEREAEYFDCKDYRLYNWGDGGSCFREGRLNEIVSHILKWNSEYVRLGLFELRRGIDSYYGRLWVFKFQDCYIATNLYCSLSDDKYELYPHILELIMEYNELDKENWYYRELKYRPFHWFYWNSDGYMIVPKGADIDDILSAIEDLPLDLRCTHHCYRETTMRIPELDNGIVRCWQCNIGVCRDCGRLTYDAIEGSDGAVCEDCAYFCDRCGRSIDREDAHYVDGAYYCSDCFHEFWTYCNHCNEAIALDEAYWAYDEPYCESCFDRLFVICDNCEEIYRRNTNDWLYCVNERGYNVIYCRDCAEDWIDICPDCGRNVHIEYMEMIDEKWVCKDCYNSNYANCDYCCETLRIEKIHFVYGERYCDECLEIVKKECQHCKRRVPIVEIVRSVKGNNFYCKDCFEKELSVICDNCGRKACIEDIETIDGKKYCYICQDKIVSAEVERIVDEILNSEL